MKVLKDKYDKTQISSLPRVQFEGRIITILCESDAKKAVDYLLNQDILGMDTETKPSFKKGSSHQVALLQIADEDTCFLFRLNRTGITTSIKKLLEDRTVPKIGLSLHDDIRALNKRSEFIPGTYIDIQNEVKNIGIEDMSLQKIYANVFGQKISKSQQLSNWEADSLSEAQQRYAATDAWACIQIYKELHNLKTSGDYILEHTSEIEDEKNSKDKSVV